MKLIFSDSGKVDLNVFIARCESSNKTKINGNMNYIQRYKLTLNKVPRFYLTVAVDNMTKCDLFHCRQT